MQLLWRVRSNWTFAGFLGFRAAVPSYLMFGWTSWSSWMEPADLLIRLLLSLGSTFYWWGIHGEQQLSSFREDYLLAHCSEMLVDQPQIWIYDQSMSYCSRINIGNQTNWESSWTSQMRVTFSRWLCQRSTSIERWPSIGDRQSSIDSSVERNLFCDFSSLTQQP